MIDLLSMSLALVFAEWCHNLEQLDPNPKHTEQMMLEVAETEDCDQAEKVLSQEQHLYLPRRNLVDLSPIAALPNLTYLELPANNIRDLSPLTQLPNIRFLDLSGNEISDLVPLASLTKIESRVSGK